MFTSSHHVFGRSNLTWQKSACALSAVTCFLSSKTRYALWSSPCTRTRGCRRWASKRYSFSRQRRRFLLGHCVHSSHTSSGRHCLLYMNVRGHLLAYRSHAHRCVSPLLACETTVDNRAPRPEWLLPAGYNIHIFLRYKCLYFQYIHHNITYEHRVYFK